MLQYFTGESTVNQCIESKESLDYWIRLLGDYGMSDVCCRFTGQGHISAVRKGNNSGMMIGCLFGHAICN